MKRFALVAAAAVLLAAVSVPGAGGQTSSGGSLVAFGAEADSYGMSASVKFLRALPLPVEVFVPRTRAQIDSQPRAIGFAAPVDLPLGELLGLLGIPITPPTFCYGYFPTTPDNPADNQCGVLPLDSSPDGKGVRLLAGAGSVRTGGDADEPEKVRVKSQASGNFMQFPTMSVGTMSTQSSTEVLDGIAVAQTEVTVGKINIAGVLQIDSITSSAVARSNGTSEVTPPKAEFAVAGVSVLGTPVRLTSAGLAIGKVPGLPPIPLVGVGVPIPDTSASLPLPTAAVVGPVVAALNGAGITFGAIEEPVTKINETGTSATAEVKGLAIGYYDAATGDFVQLRFGVATASATGSSGSDDFSESESDTDSEGDFGAGVEGGGSGGAGLIDAPSDGLPVSTVGDLGGAGASTPRATGSTGSRSTRPAEVRPRGDGLVAGGPVTPVALSRITNRLHGLYSAGALGSLVLLAGVALTMPSRRRVWAAVVTRR